MPLLPSHRALAGLLFAGLAACVPDAPEDAPRAPLPLPTQPAPPADISEGACWADAGSPPVVATLEDEVVVEPPGLAPDGTLREEPITKTARRDLVVSPGTQVWFEMLCPAALTEELVATLQRALAARELYAGPVTGQFTDETGSALRAYQAPRGIDSAALSRAAAERLGLIVTSRTE